MTPSEQRLWKALRKLDVHIRRQAPIGAFIADFACHARRLVIEVDGDIHERLDDVVLRDFERAEWLRSQGYRIVRFTNRQVDADVGSVVREIERHLALPLDGEGLGWGVTPEGTIGCELASAPNGAHYSAAPHSPQSPTLSPSRGKGA
ncbi:endonuclease domain-containing protein [Phenylobacterium sp.]|uniref:endonuclease domain-containing protein n=1 Tax=Phenylobacterium sp. TaxID=1871053 RepID=UPI0039C99811